MTYTAHPDLDAARWEDEQEARQAAAEIAEAQAFEHIKTGFLAALQHGPSAKLDLPANLPGRSASEAIYELQTSGPADIIDLAICLLARLSDPSAQGMARTLATAYANITIAEWRRA